MCGLAELVYTCIYGWDTSLVVSILVIGFLYGTIILFSHISTPIFEEFGVEGRETSCKIIFTNDV